MTGLPMYASAALPPIVDAQKGDILTNIHVVRNADDITVTLQGGGISKAR